MCLAEALYHIIITGAIFVDEVGSDDEYDPITKKKTKKGKNTPISQTGAARVNLYTLSENYDHLLSQSFDASFHDSGLGIAGTSSSQAAFGFDDDFLGGMDAENEIGDELARELGAEWGLFPEHRASRYRILCIYITMNDPLMPSFSIEKNPDQPDIALGHAVEPDTAVESVTNWRADGDIDIPMVHIFSPPTSPKAIIPFV